MKTVSVLLGLCALVIAQANENWNGYGDSSDVASFNGTDYAVSKTFTTNGTSNIRVNVFANDTASAGFSADSIRFYWGYQTGNYAFSTTNTKSPVIVWSQKVRVDTFDIRTAANMVADTLASDSLGNPTWKLKFIDTVGVTGWAAQSRVIKPAFNPYIRFWFKGYAQNKVVVPLKLVVQPVKQLWTNTR
jgi:hypothetical protein